MKNSRRTVLATVVAASFAAAMPMGAFAGIELKFSDAQQKQENQIKALRSFIAQKVDVIALAPVVESGWDTVRKNRKIYSNNSVNFGN